MTDLVTRVERGPFWVLGRIFIPRATRRAACERRGEHELELVDMGRSKLCWRCGTW